MAYMYGLINGVSQNAFSPDTNLKISEAIKLAACIHSIYHNGWADFSPGTPWYQVYVDYAMENGIISSYYPDYDEYITRSEFAVIFANALPDEGLPEINRIGDNRLPDVKISDKYGPAVYKLYRAGILTGNDSFGTFYPDSLILRKEAAAIVTRMVDPSLRKVFSLTPGNRDFDIIFDTNPIHLAPGSDFIVSLDIKITGSGYPDFRIEFEDGDYNTARIVERNFLDKAYLTIRGKMPGITSIYVKFQTLDGTVLYSEPLYVIVSPGNNTLRADEYMVAEYFSHVHDLYPGLSNVFRVIINDSKLREIRYQIAQYPHNSPVFKLLTANIYPEFDTYFFRAASLGSTSYNIEISNTETQKMLSQVSAPINVRKFAFYPGTSVVDFGDFMGLPLSSVISDPANKIYAYDISKAVNSEGYIIDSTMYDCITGCYMEYLSGFGYENVTSKDDAALFFVNSKEKEAASFRIVIRDGKAYFVVKIDEL